MTLMPNPRAALGRAPHARRRAFGPAIAGRAPIVRLVRPEPTAVVAGAAELAAHLADHHRPLLMFGRQDCEFCAAVQDLCRAIGAPLHTVDLDDPALQASGRAQALRAALAAQGGGPTLPQVFIGGQRLGGCSGTLDAWNDGRLAARLRAAGVPFRADVAIDARRLVPNWAQAF